MTLTVKYSAWFWYFSCKNVPQYPAVEATVWSSRTLIWRDRQSRKLVITHLTSYISLWSSRTLKWCDRWSRKLVITHLTSYISRTLIWSDRRSRKLVITHLISYITCDPAGLWYDVIDWVENLSLLTWLPTLACDPTGLWYDVIDGVENLSYDGGAPPLKIVEIHVNQKYKQLWKKGYSEKGIHLKFPDAIYRSAWSSHTVEQIRRVFCDN